MQYQKYIESKSNTELYKEHHLLNPFCIHYCVYNTRKTKMFCYYLCTVLICYICRLDKCHLGFIKRHVFIMVVCYCYLLYNLYLMFPLNTITPRKIYSTLEFIGEFFIKRYSMFPKYYYGG